ncbi:hypothetical protein J0K78_11710 [Halobacillus sp. GSS1]|uniref:hypothetical protein n=1 Tax=Halobacillus sp. GSS1 TaxID=2815919 RepID=UPI001A8C3A7F|nr:hypothetical protein [Halobacillus sp. GSS1]MBN9654935.1 hypothetical protein [Halobacillus sp. GSS1]
MGWIIYVAEFAIMLYLFFKVRNLEEMIEKQEYDHQEMKVSLERLHEKMDQASRHEDR